MAEAEVGDDVFGEDPTINELQQRSADLLGKEAALFIPSGTMGNLLAALSQTNPGEALILSHQSHPYRYEGGGLAMIAGLLAHPITTPLGILTTDDIQQHIIQDDNPHLAQTTLIMTENTMNLGSGAIYPLETTADIAALAQKRNIPTHCDGARIFNATVASGHSPAQYAQHTDTITFCLSKGLGCPAGSILAGDAPTIKKALHHRKRLGGGMRQAGILAAAGLHALDHHIDRLADDHRRTTTFAKAIAELPGVQVAHPAPTNMVYLKVPDAPALAQALADHDVHCIPMNPTTIRAVFHLDINDNDLDRAIDVFKRTI
jgi:threonine aldolase